MDLPLTAAPKTERLRSALNSKYTLPAVLIAGLVTLAAWFGWQALVPIILMASVIGAVVGIAMKFSSGLRDGGYIPFGPFLAGAGLTAMIFGPAAILQVIGL